VVGTNEFRISLGMTHGYTDARVDIYDAAGRVKMSYEQLGGRLVWRGNDTQGGKVPPGVYFVRLSFDVHSKIEKIILVK
jgi:hypothetical protein